MRRLGYEFQPTDRQGFVSGSLFQRREKFHVKEIPSSGSRNSLSLGLGGLVIWILAMDLCL